jgi:hypothetical protein
MPRTNKALCGSPIEKIVAPVFLGEPPDSNTVPKIYMGFCEANCCCTVFALNKRLPSIDIFEEPTPLKNFLSENVTVFVNDVVSASMREIAVLPPVTEATASWATVMSVDTMIHQSARLRSLARCWLLRGAGESAARL